MKAFAGTALMKQVEKMVLAMPDERRYDGTSDMESQMYTKVAQIKEFLSKYREKPFICCEYTHSMGNSKWWYA